MSALGWAAFDNYRFFSILLALLLAPVLLVARLILLILVVPALLLVAALALLGRVHRPTAPEPPKR